MRRNFSSSYWHGEVLSVSKTMEGIQEFRGKPGLRYSRTSCLGRVLAHCNSKCVAQKLVLQSPGILGSITTPAHINLGP